MRNSVIRSLAFLAIALAVPACLMPAFPPKVQAPDFQVNLSATPPASAFNQVITRD